METIENALSEFKKSNFEFLDTLIQNLHQYKSKEIHFQDLKIRKINTNENRDVDNLSQNLEMNKQNFIIIGAMGTGKTTCFDKIIHPFISRKNIKSPIQNYTTDIILELKNEKNEYKLIFKSPTVQKHPILTIEGYNEEASIPVLKNLGLIDNQIIRTFFISQDQNNDPLFELEDYIKDFSKFSEFFYNPKELEILEIYKKYLNSIEALFREKLQIKNQIINILIDIESDINNYEDLIASMKNFCKNFDLIKAKIQEIKDNNILREKVAKKKDINKKISDMENKLKKLNNINQFEEKVKMRTKDKIKQSYIDYDPICPICNNPISLKTFRERYNRKECFLCGESHYIYSKIQKIPDYEDNNIIILSGEFDFETELKKLKNQKIKIDKEIEKIKDSTNYSNNNLLNLMSEFYIDLNRPNFSIDEEFTRQKNLLTNYNKLLIDKKVDFEDNNKKLIELNLEIKNLEDGINLAEKHFKLYLEKLKQENDKFFSSFVNDLAKFWKMISSDNKKVVEYNQYENCLYVATISKNGNVRYGRIRSLKLRKHPGRLSSSQLNVLRYAIHFSLIKNILKKFQKLPIRSVIIDDPDNEFRNPFFKFIDEEFIRALNFQIIIFTNESEIVRRKIEEGWKYTEFNRNEKIQNSNNESFQTTLQRYIKPKSENNVEN